MLVQSVTSFTDMAGRYNIAMEPTAQTCRCRAAAHRSRWADDAGLFLKMKYGQIAGNSSINTTIYRCFEHIVDEDARRFVKKFREQLADNEQVMHTFRELLVGGFLASNAVRVRYDHVLDGTTPDWVMVAGDGELRGVVELVNFHPARAIDDQIQQRRASGRAWVGRVGPHGRRLYDRIREKGAKYKPLVERAGVPYVIAVFSEFTANVDLEEVQHCLCDEHDGLALLYPTISGILFFEERIGRYYFTYVPSPAAVAGIVLPCGAF